MCLFIRIQADGIPRQQAGTVTKRAAEAGGVRLEALRPPKSEAGARFSLGRDCACALLAKEDAWSERFYRLDPYQTAAFEKTLAVIREASGGRSFTVSAVWSDGGRVPDPHGVRRVRIDDLLRDVRQGRIANGIAYLVS